MQLHAPRSVCKRDAPCEHCSQAADQCNAQYMMKEDAAGEADDCGLDEEWEWRMDKGKIPIWHLAKRNAPGAVEGVTDVPQYGDMRVLREDDGRCSQEERRGGDFVAQRPAGMR